MTASTCIDIDWTGRPVRIEHAWVGVADLPKTATGKIQRFKLREQESKPA